MTEARLRILGTAIALALAGCGQKGPLYLPPPVAAPQSKPAESPPDGSPERPAGRTPGDVPATSEKR